MKIDIEKITQKNRNYRKVVYSSKDMQIVLMSLQPREEIGMEKHPDVTQFIRVESGRAHVIVNEKSYYLRTGHVIVIPHNTYHNIINTNVKNELKLYTIYSRPIHRKNCIQQKKEEPEC
jgi:mannose-6-phosphate isomerase-like protein (cupin superfamily)